MHFLYYYQAGEDILIILKGETSISHKYNVIHSKTIDIFLIFQYNSFDTIKLKGK